MMSSGALREQIRRRVDGWREAERRERSLREAEGAPSPAVSLAAAFELFELNPLPSEEIDPLREREEDGARTAWDRLRRGLGWQPGEPARR